MVGTFGEIVEIFPTATTVERPGASLPFGEHGREDTHESELRLFYTTPLICV